MQASIKFTAKETLVDGVPVPFTKEVVGTAIKVFLGMKV